MRANIDIWHISRIFGREKVFLKNRTQSCFKSITNTHLCAKNQEKQMMKSRENAEKAVFPAYFRQFRLKNGIRNIFHQCAKFHEKIESSAREIQEIPFFRQKSAVRAYFRKFRLQKSVSLTNEPCFMVGIDNNNVFVRINNKM